MKKVFMAITMSLMSGAAMADSVHCAKTIKGNDGTLVKRNYVVPIVNGSALINLNTFGDNGSTQQPDRFIAMARCQNGVIDLIRVIDHSNNTFAEIYSQADTLALQTGTFKTTVACQVIE